MPNTQIVLPRYTETLTVGLRVDIREENPFGALSKIRKVYIHWPDGCNALVDIAVGHGNVQFCPREGYLALNDATVEYEFNELYEKGEDHWIIMQNRDDTESHTVTVGLSIEGPLVVPEV